MSEVTQILNEDILGVEELTFSKATPNTHVFKTEEPTLLSQIYLMKEQIGEEWGEGDKVRIIALRTHEE